MGDCLLTLGAAGVGLDTNAAYRQMNNVKRLPHPPAVETPWCPSQEEYFQRIQRTPAGNKTT